MRVALLIERFSERFPPPPISNVCFVGNSRSRFTGHRLDVESPSFRPDNTALVKPRAHTLRVCRDVVFDERTRPTRSIFRPDGPKESITVLKLPAENERKPRVPIPNRVSATAVLNIPLPFKQPLIPSNSRSSNAPDKNLQFKRFVFSKKKKRFYRVVYGSGTPYDIPRFLYYDRTTSPPIVVRMV